MRCCIPHCENSTKQAHRDVHFFSFPKQTRQVWIEALKIEPNLIDNMSRVCIKHFKADDIFHFATRIKLKPGVIPSVEVAPPTQQVVEHDDHVEPVQTDNPQRKKKKMKFCFVPQIARKPLFLIENFRHNNKKIFYYSGIESYEMFLVIFRYVVKNKKGATGAVHQTPVKEVWNNLHKLTPLNEMFLTLMRLRRGFEYQTLADMFGISKSVTGKIFLAWINLLYVKLSSLKIFPHRDILLSRVTAAFRNKHPDCIGSICCTEFEIQTSSSLIRQSQCCTHYKGTNTFKALIMIDPNGAVVFSSPLFSGSLSDKEIVEDSQFLWLLRRKLELGELQAGDFILADKGFKIQDVVHNGGITLNIPTFRINGMQFSPDDVDDTRTIAHEQYVEKAIRRIKTFKILSQTIPISMLNTINEIYTVCTLLTSYMSPLIK